MFIFEILEIFISLQKILEWNILHHKGLFNEIFLTTKDSKMEMQKFLHSSQILQRATFRWKVCTHYCGRCNNVRVAALLGFSAEQLVSGEPGPEYLTNGWLELSSIQDSQLWIKNFFYLQRCAWVWSPAEKIVLAPDTLEKADLKQNFYTLHMLRKGERAGTLRTNLKMQQSKYTQ